MDLKDRLEELLSRAGGKTALYAENLTTGETVDIRADMPLMAASVIKLPILVECFAAAAEGRFSPDEEFVIRSEDKYPSCGALNYMHNGLKVTAEDLYTLMIILSDNTATNLLIDRLGMDRINARLDSLGMTGTRLNRRLFDAEKSAAGIENYIVPREIGGLLKTMYRGEVISPEASEEMLSILRDQQLNGKIPVLLPPHIDVAHKTGEDTGITHDVGIVYGPQPFVICVCANDTDTGRFVRDIQEMSQTLYRAWGGEE